MTWLGISGPAIGCVRVLTANDGSGPKPVYAVWKMPAPTAMSDNFWQEGSLLADLDLDTGAVKSCLRGTGPQSEMLTEHPVSHAQLVGTVLPCWSETLQTAIGAHLVFPEFGVCGFDIAVTNDGPSILECNDNPAHMLYQLATHRGVQNPDLAPYLGGRCQTPGCADKANEGRIEKETLSRHDPIARLI